MRGIARLGLHFLAAGLMAHLPGGCASNTSPLANITPIERQFVVAAPTWDFDHDGVVTCDEWRQYAGKLFAEVDQGRKGYLTAAEFRNVAGQDKLFETADFAYFDINGDGVVNQAEFVERPNPAFRLLDRDNDCRLTNEELVAAYNPDRAAKTKSANDARKPRRGG